MVKFVTKEYTDIKAREIVDELFVDGKGAIELLESELIGTTYTSEIDVIVKYIEHFANGNSVGAKMKFLKGGKDNIREMEFRSKHLRIFLIQQTSKKIIIFGGIKRKADSSDNIKSFRLLKQQYLEFLKNTK